MQIQDRDSTLFVSYGGAAGYANEQLQHLLAKNFGDWGPLASPPFVVSSKAIAFVRFHWRASAEFAKEAMDGQGLDGSKFKVRRWAPRAFCRAVLIAVLTKEAMDGQGLDGSKFKVRNKPLHVCSALTCL